MYGESSISTVKVRVLADFHVLQGKMEPSTLNSYVSSFLGYYISSYSMFASYISKCCVPGFHKHCSTDTCLSYLTDKVRTGFEKGLLTGMLLINLQKAFDTIGHGIFLDKMNCLGFSNSTVTWFNSYLTNKSFIVNVGKEYSSPGKFSCGVPQDSILGPLLFLLYVNEMPQAVNSELLLYADDTCLIYMGKDTKTIEERLDRDFNSLCVLFIDNKLSTHFGKGKTKSILFGTKRHLKIRQILTLNTVVLKSNSTAR